MHSAAVKQLNTPPARRPHASEIHEHRNRPAIRYGDPDPRLGGLGRRDLEHHHEQGHLPQRQPDTARLAEARQGAGEDAARIFCKAQASERRASSKRPMRISQCGDSGTQARMYRVRSAGSKPTANRPRHPI